MEVQSVFWDERCFIDVVPFELFVCVICVLKNIVLRDLVKIPSEHLRFPYCCFRVFHVVLEGLVRVLSVLLLTFHLGMRFLSFEAEPFVWRPVSVDFEVDQSLIHQGPLFASSMSSAVVMMFGRPHELDCSRSFWRVNRNWSLFEKCVEWTMV